MNVNLPRKYFLSRKTVLNRIDVSRNAEGVAVIRTPAVVMENYKAVCWGLYGGIRIWSKHLRNPILFDNGGLVALCFNNSAKSFHEKKGEIVVANEYEITYCNCKRKVLARIFTRDLKYAFVLCCGARSGIFTPFKSELCLIVVKFDEDANSFRNGVFVQELFVLKLKKEITEKLSTCISPKGNYLCFVIAIKDSMYLYVYNIDFARISVQFESSVDISAHFNLEVTDVLVEMNESETLILIKKRTTDCKAALYSPGDNLLHTISCNKEFEILFCCYLEHKLHGYLIFMLEYNRNKNNCVVEILKYKTMGLERWIKINMTDEFGIKNKVDDFVVQGSMETRMFISYSSQIHVVDVFSRALLYIIAPADVLGVIKLYVNWNGQEIFAVTPEREFKMALQVFYVPRKDELSLKHTAAITVMASYSASYLKSLNLPKIIKYLLKIG